MTSEYRTFLRGYERNIFSAARQGGTSLSFTFFFSFLNTKLGR